MKLVTFQSFDALKYLINNGELICDKKYFDEKKYGIAYNFIVNKMNSSILNNTKARYPIWCFVKCYNGICPPRHKGKRIDGYDVKITFEKNSNEVFVTDFRRYSFVLNNKYIPKSINDKNIFTDELKKHGNDKYINNKIVNSFDRCITMDSDILQGCVWNIKLSEVCSIEILKNDGYVYGSLNYVRSNGKRINWIEDYYKRIN